jgi:uncharacterized secreted protein with C-terminal beta-propeller domain
MRSLPCSWILALLVPLTGCSGSGDSSTSGDPANPPQTGSNVAALKSLRTCADVDAAVRAAATRAMHALIDESIQQAHQALDAGNCWMNSGVMVEDEMASTGTVLSTGATSNAAAPASDTSQSPSAVSETNNQVVGVDEADFIKNDQDGTIYVIANGALVTIDGWPAAESRVLQRLPLAATPKKLLVQGNRLLVYSSIARTKSELAQYQSWWINNAKECTYGYDCDFTGDGQKTRLSIYDITDRAAPVLVRTLDTSATFISARRIGSAVHTVLYEEPELLRKLPVIPPALSSGGVCTGTQTLGTAPYTYTAPAPAAGDRERADTLFEALRAQNVAAIEQAPLAELLGTLEDRLVGGSLEGTELAACNGFYDSPLADGTAFLKLVSLDLESDLAAQTSTIISRAGASYASDSAYYVSVRQNPYSGHWYPGMEDIQEASTVHKFQLAGASNAYQASGVVKGRVLNQFSLDEYQGNLRIATTTGHVPDPKVHSTLSVLAPSGDSLQVVGMVDQIAPTEDIRSVRFVGGQGYVVTFEKTDPLFVFDLSEPKNPRITGELKIPGYSTYMHPLDATHLLTIGYDAADQGSFSYFQGLMLQIFDVSDPTQPQLVHKVTIGTRGSSSEAATNHLAFNYFAARKVLALPITVCEASAGSGTYGNLMTFSGVQFYDISVDQGITLRGAVPHPYVDPYSPATYYLGGACANWWTSSSSVVQRTLFMDDFVYTVSSERIKVNHLDALSTDVAEVGLE